MIRFSIHLCAALAVVVGGAAICRSAMLNLVPMGNKKADITAFFVAADYNAGTDMLSILGTAMAIDYDGIGPPDATIAPGGAGFPSSYAINVQVDSTGSLSGAPTPTDLVIKGVIAGGPHPSPVYGDLLRGSVLAFGYSDTTPTLYFEFIFKVTGGSQAPQFGSHVGVVFNTIDGFDGTFAGSFLTNFGGSADNFAIPEPSTLLLATVGLGILAAARFRRRWRSPDQVC